MFGCWTWAAAWASFLKRLDLLRVVSRRERQDLQRHAPPKRDLLRLVDDAHAAPADLADEPKVADRLRRTQVASRPAKPLAAASGAAAAWNNFKPLR